MAFFFNVLHVVFTVNDLHWNQKLKTQAAQAYHAQFLWSACGICGAAVDTLGVTWCNSRMMAAKQGKRRSKRGRTGVSRWGVQEEKEEEYHTKSA